MTEAVYKKELIALANGEVVQARYLSNGNITHGCWFDIKVNTTAMEQLVRGFEKEDFPMDIRIKPKTHIVCGHEINAPETVMPENGMPYFVPVGKLGKGECYYCDNDTTDETHLLAGLLYIDEKDAIAHSEAWANPK